MTYHGPIRTVVVVIFRAFRASLSRRLWGGTHRTRTHRLLYRPEPPLSGTIECCGWQSTPAIRRRTLPSS